MEKISIGGVLIDRTAALAPMAGVCDTAFRTVCKECGASYAVGELTSSKGLYYGDKKSETLLHVTQSERPMAVQLFGNEPEVMARAAEAAMKFAPEIIDLNMGCPAPKIVSGGAGSRLMTDPELAGRITEAVVRAVPIPVTVKFRKGWDDNSVNAVEFAKIMEQSGAAAVTVHGRTSKQMYAPSVDLDIIKSVKEAVSIPVIGNGDVTDLESCLHMYSYTGCDLVMIGRGALGDPFLFSRIKAYFESGEILPPATLEQKLSALLRQAAISCNNKGETSAIKEMRKHAAWYIKGTRDAAVYRARSSSLNTYKDLENMVDEILSRNAD